MIRLSIHRTLKFEVYKIAMLSVGCIRNQESAEDITKTWSIALWNGLGNNACAIGFRLNTDPDSVCRICPDMTLKCYYLG